MNKEQTVYTHNYSNLWKSLETQDILEEKLNNRIMRRNIFKLKKVFTTFSIIQRGTTTKYFSIRYE